jgi:mono/diheme cytochrome c family protein
MKVKIGFGIVAITLIATMLPYRPAAAEEVAPTAAVEPEQVDAQMVAKGKTLYAHHCAHCHGFNMVNPGTVTYDLRQFPRDDKARFVHSVTNGKNGRMPQWGDLLRRDEIDDLWAYVKTGGRE